MSNSSSETHQCEWLAYEGRRINYPYQDDPIYKRCALYYDKAEKCIQDYVLFCPGCGLRFEEQTGTMQDIGRPKMCELLIDFHRKDI